MLDITKDIQSLTTFRRRSGDFMKQLKKSKRAVVLTVKGKAAAVVQDAEAYQRLLDIAFGEMRCQPLFRRLRREKQDAGRIGIVGRRPPAEQIIDRHQHLRRHWPILPSAIGARFAEQDVERVVVHGMAHGGDPSEKQDRF